MNQAGRRREASGLKKHWPWLYHPKPTEQHPWRTSRNPRGAPAYYRRRFCHFSDRADEMKSQSNILHLEKYNYVKLGTEDTMSSSQEMKGWFSWPSLDGQGGRVTVVLLCFQQRRRTSQIYSNFSTGRDALILMESSVMPRKTDFCRLDYHSGIFPGVVLLYSGDNRMRLLN